MTEAAAVATVNLEFYVAFGHIAAPRMPDPNFRNQPVAVLGSRPSALQRLQTVSYRLPTACHRPGAGLRNGPLPHPNQAQAWGGHRLFAPMY